MTGLPFVALDDPRYAQAVQVSPLITRVIAENPSKFTYHGTGTYLVGAGRDVAVIDPGPLLDAHRDALRAALQGRRVRAVLVTHCHSDHSPLAAWLAAETGAPTVAVGPHPRVEVEPDDEPDDDPDGATSLDGATPADGPMPEEVRESVDHDFRPDIVVGAGDIAAAGDGFTITAVPTPGHTSNHCCFALADERALFTGDHVMGWSTTVITPPDGDMAAYFTSLQLVIDRRDEVLWPTHGAPVTDPQPYLAAFMAHRRAREAQVLAAVRAGDRSIRTMVDRLYAEVRRELHKAARRSVLAHLVKLVDDGVVTTADGAPPTLRAVYHPV